MSRRTEDETQNTNKTHRDMKTSYTTTTAQDKLNAIIYSLTPKKRRFIAMAQVVLELYGKMKSEIGNETTALAATWRTLLDSDEYEWFRKEYPEYPTSRDQIRRIVKRKNATQRKIEDYEKKFIA